MNILIVRLSSLGDIIHALPAVPLLKEHFPECTVDWVVEPAGAELLTGYPGIDRVIILKKKDIISSLRTGRIISAARCAAQFVQKLRQRCYDVVLDFQGLFKSGLVVSAARGRRKIGFANAREGAVWCYTERVCAPAKNEHALKRQLALLEGLGIAAQRITYSRFFTASEEAELMTLLKRHGIDSTKPIVCVHPCSRWRTKQWELHKIAALCDKLHTTCGANVVLIGGKDEQCAVEAVAQQCRMQVYCTAGILSLHMVAALLARSALLVSPDSGPLHLAGALGIPVVGLFGPTAPWRTGPFGKHVAVVRKELPCSPCFQRSSCPEGHHRCMRDITVAEVVEVCCNLIRKSTES